MKLGLIQNQMGVLKEDTGDVVLLNRVKLVKHFLVALLKLLKSEQGFDVPLRPSHLYFLFDLYVLQSFLDVSLEQVVKDVKIRSYFVYVLFLKVLQATFDFNLECIILKITFFILEFYFFTNCQIDSCFMPLVSFYVFKIF